MKKIIFVITKPNWGGAQRYVFDLVTALREKNIVKVVTGETSGFETGDQLLGEKLSILKIPVIKINTLQRDVFWLKEILTLARLIKIFSTEKPDCVHLNSSKAGGIGALAARIALVPKIIFTAHGLPFNEDRSKLQLMLLWFFTWLTFLMCDKIISISNNDLRQIVKMPFCARKTILIPNGINPKKIFFEKREKALAILGVKTKPGRQIVGVIAELTKNKGIEYLLEAAKNIEPKKEIQIVIIGAGEDKNKLKNLVAKKQPGVMIDFIGFVPKAYLYLKAFDIFVLPSVKEGLPYVLLEAGLAARPVVATAVGGVPEIILEEKTGLLTPPKNPALIAAAISRLLTDPNLAKRLGSALREHILNNYSIEKMIKKTEALYE